MTLSKIAISVTILGSIALGMPNAHALNADSVINGSNCDFGAFGQSNIVGQNSALSYNPSAIPSESAHAYYPHDQKWIQEGPIQAIHNKGSIYNRGGLRFAGIGMALCAAIE